MRDERYDALSQGDKDKFDVAMREHGSKLDAAMEAHANKLLTKPAPDGFAHWPAQPHGAADVFAPHFIQRGAEGVLVLDEVREEKDDSVFLDGELYVPHLVGENVWMIKRASNDGVDGYAETLIKVGTADPVEAVRAAIERGSWT
jgi:hypothetical protein